MSELHLRVVLFGTNHQKHKKSIICIADYNFLMHIGADLFAHLTGIITNIDPFFDVFILVRIRISDQLYSVVLEYPLRVREVKGFKLPEAESYQRL